MIIIVEAAQRTHTVLIFYRWVLLERWVFTVCLWEDPLCGNSVGVVWANRAGGLAEGWVGFGYNWIIQYEVLVLYLPFTGSTRRGLDSLLFQKRFFGFFYYGFCWVTLGLMVCDGWGSPFFLSLMWHVRGHVLGMGPHGYECLGFCGIL